MWEEYMKVAHISNCMCIGNIFVNDNNNENDKEWPIVFDNDND